MKSLMTFLIKFAGFLLQTAFAVAGTKFGKTNMKKSSKSSEESSPDKKMSFKGILKIGITVLIKRWSKRLFSATK